MTTALEQGLSVCHVCMSASPQALERCPRCHAALHARIPHSVQRTVAFGIAAAVMYLPANLLPIMITDQLGRAEQNTIISGVLHLWSLGSYPVAIVILIASVLIPLGKLAALALLCWAVTRGSARSSRQRTALYRVTELVGKWSMVDVFVVAVLVALIQMGGVMEIRLGAAALAFAAVVVLTMLAAGSFDPRLIWDLHLDGEPAPDE